MDLRGLTIEHRKTPLYKIELLSTGLFIDNGYLDMYVSLINLNIGRKFNSATCQRHRIIPKEYFKYLSYEEPFDGTNRVVLVGKDHLIAHLLLGMCSANEKLRSINFTCLKKAIKKLNLEVELQTTDDEVANVFSASIEASRSEDMINYIKDLMETSEYKYLETAYNEQLNLSRLIGLEQMCGKNSYYYQRGYLRAGKNNPNYGRHDVTAYWKGKFGKDHIRYGTKHTEETKKKMSESMAGKVFVRKGDEKVIRIDKELLDDYLKDGYIRCGNRGEPFKESTGKKKDADN